MNTSLNCFNTGWALQHWNYKSEVTQMRLMGHKLLYIWVSHTNKFIIKRCLWSCLTWASSFSCDKNKGKFYSSRDSTRPFTFHFNGLNKKSPLKDFLVHLCNLLKSIQCFSTKWTHSALRQTGTWTVTHALLNNFCGWMGEN